MANSADAVGVAGSVPIILGKLQDSYESCPEVRDYAWPLFFRLYKRLPLSGSVTLCGAQNRDRLGPSKFARLLRVAPLDPFRGWIQSAGARGAKSMPFRTPEQICCSWWTRVLFLLAMTADKKPIAKPKKINYISNL